ncbi:MAG: hypothetical protein V1716_04210 [Candidatus Uhrbacteria bacterium]
MFFPGLKSSTLLAVSGVPTTILKTPATNSVNSSAPAKGSFFDFLQGQAFNSGQTLELFFRGLRVASAVFAIFFIFLLLQGALQYIISSGSDDKVRHCRYLVFVGGTGMVVMFCIYLIATSSLIRLGAVS